MKVVFHDEFETPGAPQRRCRHFADDGRVAEKGKKAGEIFSVFQAGTAL
jgi:hypothetical protein